jgi:hypothetical protein
MNTRLRWTIALGALLLAAGVGYLTYNAGFSNGIEQSGKIVAAPPGAVPYYWHGPHFGFFFFPFFFIAFWLLAFRAFRGHHHHRPCRYDQSREDHPRG